MVELPGFETDIASYCTDIPNFEELNVKPILYGPGSIHFAHKDDEQITIEELLKGIDGYKNIFYRISELSD